MFIPFFTPYKYNSKSKRGNSPEASYDDLNVEFDVDGSLHELEKRRGGGGRGGGGRGGGSSGGSSGGGTSRPLSGTSGRTSSAYSNGGGAKTTIPSGSPFAGRSEGGGTRQQVYGSSTYGSGFPDRGFNTRGVGGVGFPFYFWPMTWGAGLGVGGGAYLHNREYGDTDNSSRPGGPMMYSTYVSLDTTKNSTFHVVADNTTVVELMQDIEADCGSLINNGSSTLTGSGRNPTALKNDSSSQPQPESSVQYYRASSLSLTLDGYNNTAALSDNESAPASPLPNNYDGSLLACLNTTIGEAAVLVDGDGAGALVLLPAWLMLGIGMSVGAVMAI